MKYCYGLIFFCFFFVPISSAQHDSLKTFQKVTEKFRKVNLLSLKEINEQISLYQKEWIQAIPNNKICQAVSCLQWGSLLRHKATLLISQKSDLVTITQKEWISKNPFSPEVRWLLLAQIKWYQAICYTPNVQPPFSTIKELFSQDEGSSQSPNQETIFRTYQTFDSQNREEIENQLKNYSELWCDSLGKDKAEAYHQWAFCLFCKGKQITIESLIQDSHQNGAFAGNPYSIRFWIVEHLASEGEYYFLRAKICALYSLSLNAERERTIRLNEAIDFCLGE
jgi:hypothetical protein